MKPKQWIRYVKKLEKRNLAICDGMSYDMGIDFTGLYFLFTFTGVSLFIWMMVKLKLFKNKSRSIFL